jgi:acetyl-CoA carboxylase biotin carboxyl carrier protein
MKSHDTGDLAAIVDLLLESDFTEVRISVDGVDLAMSRRPGGLGCRGHAAPMADAPAVQPKGDTLAPDRRDLDEPQLEAQATTTTIPEGTVVVEASMLGTFYRSPRPGEPPFVEIGAQVEPNTRVAIVEAMKLMNEVRAGVSGIVEAVLVADGELVEYGQPLFAVRLL